MKVSLTLECNCGNTMTYTANNKYHVDTHAVYVDLTETVDDDNYRAKPIPTGTWINCGKCDSGFEVV